MFVDQIDTEATDRIAQSYCAGKNFKVEKELLNDEMAIYELAIDDLRQRLSFTRIEV